MPVNKKTDNWTPCDKAPDWDDAPDWANWIVHGFDGNWYWVENHPHNMNEGRIEICLKKP